MANQTPALGMMPGGTLEDLRRHWGWFVGIGIALIVLGLIALFYAAGTTMVSMMVIGWLLIVGGVIDGVHAFGEQTWSGFFIDLFTGVLYLVAGFILVANPAASAVGLTLVIAMFLIVSGIFRGIAALAIRPLHWGWLLMHAIISLVLGILIWQNWPVSGLLAIGLFVGIEIIANGVTMVMLGSMARKLPADTATA